MPEAGQQAATGPARKAVILARGLGTRMRKASAEVALNAQQAAAADAGLKSMISVGRPFVDYLLANLAEAGVTEVCFVVAPDHDSIRRHCESLPLERIRRITFAVQAEPRGTADALRAARDFAGDDPFLMVNSDNLYPVAALAGLVRQSGPAVIGFSRAGLLRGNIERERVRHFAALEVAADGRLVRIVEKPSSEELARLAEAPVGMNCWRFDHRIFAACEAIGPSPRGEFELPDAVQYAMAHAAVAWRVVPSDEPVLDLTRRDDIATVAEALADAQVRL